MIGERLRIDFEIEVKKWESYSTAMNLLRSELQSLMFLKCSESLPMLLRPFAPLKFPLETTSNVLISNIWWSSLWNWEWIWADLRCKAKLSLPILVKPICMCFCIDFIWGLHSHTWLNSAQNKKVDFKILTLVLLIFDSEIGSVEL